MRVSYRADVVGSLVAPPELETARDAHRAGSLSPAQFKRVEDAAIDEVIALQEAAGVDVVTDGELRRTHFAGPLIDACDGLEAKPAPQRRYYTSSGDKTTTETPRSVTGHLTLRRSLVTEEFVYARRQASKPIKITLPAATMMAMFWSPEHSRPAYRDAFELFADAVGILKQEVDELARLGCEVIQIDAPELAMLVDPDQREHFAGVGIDPDRLLTEGIEMLNAVASRSDVQFALHLCKGSKNRGFMAKGGYDAIASQVFRGATAFDQFLLEYDDDRSGSFEPLKAVSDDKVVVLGLVSTRRSELEEVPTLINRINEAARHFPREQLALSTQCGFASGLRGDEAGMKFQSDKLRLVAETAHQAWA